MWLTVIFGIFLVCFIILCMKPAHENFLPYNVPVVDTSKDETIFEKESRFLSRLFESQKKEDIPSDTTNFEQFPFYMKFPLDSFLNEAVGTVLANLLKDDEGKPMKVAVMKSPYNLMTRTDTNNNTKHYILYNTDVNLTGFGSTRKLLVFLVINNAQKYLLPTGGYSPLPIGISNDIQLLNIQLDDTKASEVIGPQVKVYNPANYTTYHEIRNPLHLLDPFATSTEDLVVTDDMVALFEKSLERKTKQMQESDGICFNTTNVSSKTKDECLNSGGTWDYEPRDKDECPFHMANENYPNTFGGLQPVFCELPQNAKRIGFRHYSLDPEYAPLCYNCKTDLVGNGTLGKCCEEQKKKALYPNLISPDYAFAGDQSVRQQYADLLASKNMSVN
jgi:hypothetical protein